MNQLVKFREENIADKIYFIRGEKVMLDSDLAALYEIETRVLKQAVRRNRKRFPDDFMFELSDREIDWLLSQHVIPSKSYLGGARPFAFTEQGVAMLSSVLKSGRAIEVNIAIMRTFVQLRKLLKTNKELASKIEQLEQKYDENFRIVFEVLKQLTEIKSQPKRKLGYKNYDNK